MTPVSLTPGPAAGHASHPADPAAAWGRAAGRRADVAEAIGRLNEDDRRVLDLMIVHGLSRRVAAAELGLTESETRTRLAKAKTRLGRLLAGHGPAR